MQKKFFHTICFLLNALFCHAQFSGNLVLTLINEENGLSDNHVTAVLKDKKGLVWIGTQDGLNVLDGSAIKVFRHSDGDGISISNNYIHAIKEDADGNIWIATSLGLNCYNKKLQRIFRYPLAASPYGTSEIIFSITLDGEFVWCGTDGGLIKFNMRTHKSTFLECGKTEPIASRRFCNKIN